MKGRIPIDPTFGPEFDPAIHPDLDPATVAELTGLAVEDFHPSLPIQIVSTGTAFAVVPVRSVAALAHLQVRGQQAYAWLRQRGARCFYAVAPTGKQTAQGLPEWRARMPFHGGEDPATGSAAGCAISLLVRHGAVASGQQILMRQGVEMGRPSELFLTANRVLASDSARVTDVRVGGSTVLVAKGRIFLP